MFRNFIFEYVWFYKAYSCEISYLLDATETSDTDFQYFQYSMYEIAKYIILQNNRTRYIYILS